MAKERALGRVKWFNSQKGFGFILLNDGRDVYLPYTALSEDLQQLIEKDLWEGVTVECEADQTDQGLRAIVAVTLSEKSVEAPAVFEGEHGI